MAITTHIVNGQDYYSIDKAKLKQSQRLTFKERQYIRKAKKEIKTKKKQEKKKQKKIDSIAKKYEEKYQTKSVRKRMKETRKMAKKFNEGKPQVKGFEYIKYKIKKFYGRIF